MDYSRWSSLPQLFFHQAERLGDRPFLWGKEKDSYRPHGWSDLARRVKDLSRGLRALGVKPGDRVALVSENRPEWFIAHFAIMSAGAITVPAYTTNTPADHLHILTHSGAVGAIVSTPALAKRLLPAVVRAPDCHFVVALEELGLQQKSTAALRSWSEVEAEGASLPDDVGDMIASLTRQAVCIFIYTSGTGGTPKGVQLSHGNVLANCRAAYDLLSCFGLGKEVFLSFLPLSHSYEHSAGLCFPMSIGAEIYYAESVEALGTNMQEVRPTIMTAVPRLYETLHGRLRLNLAKQPPLRQRLFETALQLGLKRHKLGQRLTLKERLVDATVDKLVRDKVRARFGGRLKALVSGGAALNPDIGWFFQALGLTLLQGYGQTEASPVVSCNRPQLIKMQSVGPALEGVEVRTAEDGEILVRGELVMQGYWRDPEATANAIRDGWLHTGDIGHIDEDGYIFITDRKKDILVLSGGDNVSPARIEGILTLEPEIEQAMVYGDRRPNLVALLVPNRSFMERWASENGKPDDLADLREDPAFREAIGRAVERVNQRLSSIEKIRRFVIAREPFSTENEMMTPTMKIRRHKIRAAYGGELDALYERRSA